MFRSILMLLGRLALSAVFLWSGLNKIFEFQTSILKLQELTGITNDLATWAIIVSLIVELVFGILLLFGWLTRFAASVLILYTVIMVAALHQFWALEGLDRTFDSVGIIGGLLYVLACGAGYFSCDAVSQSKSQ